MPLRIQLHVEFKMAADLEYIPDEKKDGVKITALLKCDNETVIRKRNTQHEIRLP